MARRAAARAAEAEVEGIRISHPDRVIYPRLGITKLDVARYYATMGRWILPHVRGRPLTLVHCPEGLRAPCSYMRHSKVWGPAVLRRVRIREKTKVGEYLVADSIPAVVALAQMGVLEIHTWNSTTDDLERPNRLVWDLDPGPAVAWRDVVEAAKLLRSVLELLQLEAWVKTTGGHGLHVVVPIEPVRDWSECLTFARGVADAIARSEPDRFTTVFAKERREGRILIDYLRNNRTNTSVAAFSTRARDAAPVSAPLTWNALGARPPVFDLQTIIRRFARLRGDPWAKYWATRQRISDRAVEALRRM